MSSIEKYVQVGEFVKEYNTFIKVESAKRRGWTDWDMIREFVQNSLDASGVVDIERLDDGIKISDRGGGFDATSFLIGESTKNPECDRGQFGDGMKMACATAYYRGYEAWIHTKGFIFRATVKPTEFVIEEGAKYIDTLHFEQYTAPRINGTDVYILGYRGPTYRGRFILYDGHDEYEIPYSYIVDKSSMCERNVVYRACIMRPSGKLFVRDIYVEDLEDALFSYNLVDVKLGVDRKIAASSDVDKEVAILWCMCSNPELIREFVRGLVSNRDCYEYNINWYVNSTYDITKNWNLWLQAIEEVYPRAVVGGKPMFYYAESNEEIDLVKYYAPEYVYIPLPESLLNAFRYYGLIRRASEIVAERRKALYTIIRDSELDKDERRVLNFIRRIHDKLTEMYSEPSAMSDRFGVVVPEAMEDMRNLTIRAIKHEDPKVIGIYDASRNVIGIARKRLIDRRWSSPVTGALETYSHELVHVVLGGDKESNSVDFMRAQQEVLLDILSLIANREVRMPRL